MWKIIWMKIITFCVPRAFSIWCWHLYDNNSPSQCVFIVVTYTLFSSTTCSAQSPNKTSRLHINCPLWEESWIPLICERNTGLSSHNVGNAESIAIKWRRNDPYHFHYANSWDSPALILGSHVSDELPSILKYDIYIYIYIYINHWSPNKCTLCSNNDGY